MTARVDEHDLRRTVDLVRDAIARGYAPPGIKMHGQSAALGRDFDMALIGHWHQTLWLPNCCVNGALKGFDEYAMKSLRARPQPPTQSLFFVHPKRGITARWEITLDEPARRGASEWVSWKH